LCEFYATQIHIDDNLLIPLSYCFSTSLLDFIAGL
jgi:dolichol kinase